MSIGSRKEDRNRQAWPWWCVISIIHHIISCLLCSLKSFYHMSHIFSLSCGKRWWEGCSCLLNAGQVFPVTSSLFMLLHCMCPKPMKGSSACPEAVKRTWRQAEEETWWLGGGEEKLSSCALWASFSLSLQCEHAYVVVAVRQWRLLQATNCLMEEATW